MKRRTNKWTAALLVLVFVFGWALTACSKTEEGAAEPTPLAVPVISLNKETGVISWSAVDHATGYLIYENDTALSSPVTTTSYTITKTAPGTYTYAVAAISTDTAYKTSAKSNTVTYTIPEGPVDGGTLELCSIYTIDSGLLKVSVLAGRTTIVQLDEEVEKGSYAFLAFAGNMEEVEDESDIESVPVTLAVGNNTYDLSKDNIFDIEVEEGVTSLSLTANGAEGSDFYIALLEERTQFDAPTKLAFGEEQNRVLTWDGPDNAEAYIIYKNGNEIATVTESTGYETAKYYLIDDDDSAQYTVAATVYSINARLLYTPSAQSEPISFAIDAGATAIDAPTNVTTTGRALNWDAVSNAYAYNVYENGKLVGSHIKAISYTITNTTAGTYNYTVVAIPGNTAHKSSVASDAASYEVVSKKLKVGEEYQAFTGAYKGLFAYIELDSSVAINGYYGQYYKVTVEVDNDPSLFAGAYGDGIVGVTIIGSADTEEEGWFDWEGGTSITVDDVAIRPERVLIISLATGNQNVSEYAITVTLEASENENEPPEAGLPPVDMWAYLGVGSWGTATVELVSNEAKAVEFGASDAVEAYNLSVTVNSTIRDGVAPTISVSADGEDWTALTANGKVYTGIIDPTDFEGTIYFKSTAAYTINVTAKLSVPYTKINEGLASGGTPVTASVSAGERIAIPVINVVLYTQYTLKVAVANASLEGLMYAILEDDLVEGSALTYDEDEEAYISDYPFMYQDEEDNCYLFISNGTNQALSVTVSLAIYVESVPALDVAGEYGAALEDADEPVFVPFGESVVPGTYGVASLDRPDEWNPFTAITITVGENAQTYTLNAANGWYAEITVASGDEGLYMSVDAIGEYGGPYINICLLSKIEKDVPVTITTKNPRVYFELGSTLPEGEYTVTVSAPGLGNKLWGSLPFTWDGADDPLYNPEVNEGEDTCTFTITVDANNKYFSLSGWTSKISLTITIAAAPSQD